MQELDSAQIHFDTDNLWILNLALAIVMFGVALGISISDFKFLIKAPKAVFVGLLSQFVLLPLLTFGFIYFVNPQPSIALGMMMVAACPGGNISNFMTHMAGGNTALSISLTAISTFLAIIMTPFNFEFYGYMYEPTAKLLQDISLNPFDMVKIVLLILGVPLICGMLVRYKFPELSIRLSRWLKPFSLAVFIGIVVAAIANNMDVFSQYIHFVFALGMIHNLLAFVMGFLVARVFKLSFQNQKTLTIETGIQNSGIGLLLIFTFFDGLGGMAIMAAFWGVWHIVSGLFVAYFWSTKHDENTESY
ncbi:bile acid:sodium symporter family protein [Bizionia myxarmorum]|uniref:Bile acid:sodium symporter family protein n=1 Tax=Bizionia myxarmorum TaxID=291186 RepID=A0A5D0R6F8_9FLAO|nr:bile acid:sodium symporter family protein [Bizionia myxarmorum]TYB77023.1 bile acid:sodium symporter family protein [Bizionia myxarmorum]